MPEIKQLAVPETIQTPLKKYSFTVETYHSLIEKNVLSEDSKVELINGELIEMSPINSLHAGTVNRLIRLLTLFFGEKAILSVQNPVTLSILSEPEPDLAVLIPRPDFYTKSHPSPTEILIIIEVADSSIAKDRQIKLPLYAAAGIPEAWLVDLSEQAIEVHTQPSAVGYSRIHIFRRGDTIQTGQVEGLPVDEILG